MSQDAITTLVKNSISAEVKNEIEVMVASGKFENLILKAAEKFIKKRYSVSDTIDDTIEKAINPFVGSVIADLPDNYFDLILDEAKETLKEILSTRAAEFIKNAFRDQLYSLAFNLTNKLIDQKDTKETILHYAKQDVSRLIYVLVDKQVTELIKDVEIDKDNFEEKAIALKTREVSLNKIFEEVCKTFTSDDDFKDALLDRTAELLANTYKK